MYKPVPCTQEQLVPVRWVCSINGPSREVVVDHLKGLRERWGNSTARECKARMLWIGIFPVRTPQQRELRCSL